MKKKLIVVLCAAVLIAAGAGAWFYGYSHRKSTDNIPTKEMVYLALSEDAENPLLGYHRDQLTEVWGKPDISLFGMFGDIWEADGLGTVIVYYDDDAVVVNALAEPES